jgi:alpha-maltose-1-phosphate synthase
MKIAYVVPYNWGGMIHYTAELANAVSEYAEVAVLGSKDMPKKYFSDNIEIINVFGDLNFSPTNFKTALSYNNLHAFLSFKCIKSIETVQPDIIHFTTPLFHIPFFVKLYGLDRKIPVIQTVHSPFQEDTFLMEKVIHLDTLMNNLITYKKTIVHSQRDKEEIIKRGTFSENDIVVIPHGVYDVFNRYNIDNELQTKSTEKNCILFFGYIKKYKGLEYLIRSIPYINKEIADIKVIIAGEGDLSYYYDLIENYCPSIRDYLEIHNDFIPDKEVSLLFQRASLVVIPYAQMTGQSGIATIGLAFGKPIVATNAWAFNEVLEDGETGYLVPPKDPEALSKAIIRILKDDNLRVRMGNNAFKKGQELSWDNMAKKHIAVYKEVFERSNLDKLKI